MKLYTRKPIRSLESLTHALRIPKDRLLKTSQDSDRFYKEFNKGKRKLCRVQNPLKLIQKKLKNNILDCIKYPNFIHGGVRGRSAESCAKTHCNKSVLITLDIKNFYPSITSEQIFNLWKYSFHFSKEVSGILTRLTTYKDKLPLGSSTSSHLANLVLLADGTEVNLYEKLKVNGYEYTRYVDDISISSKKNIRSCDKTLVINKVIGFVKSKGYQINNKKIIVYGSKDQKQMLGYWLGKKRLRKSEEYCARLIDDCRHRIISIKSLIGKLQHIKNVDPKKTNRIRKYLEAKSYADFPENQKIA